MDKTGLMVYILLVAVYVLCSTCLIRGVRSEGYDYDESDYGGESGGHGQVAHGKKGGLIDVDVRDTHFGGKHVGVHVPIFYKMDLDKDFHRTGLGINVLEGLVKVRVKKDPFKAKNNVFVSLAGVPLWYQR